MGLGRETVEDHKVKQQKGVTEEPARTDAILRT